MTLNPTPPPLAWLCHARAFVHVVKYVWTMHILTPSTLATPWVETITTFHQLHPLVKVDLPPFIKDFHPKTYLILDREAFLFVLTHSPRFSSNNPLGMVYKLLQGCFVPNDSASGFDFFSRYVGTLLVVMFLHQYHTCLLHCYYWLWRNKLEMFDPSRLERWLIN